MLPPCFRRDPARAHGTSRERDSRYPAASRKVPAILAFRAKGRWLASFRTRPTYARTQPRCPAVPTRARETWIAQGTPGVRLGMPPTVTQDETNRTLRIGGRSFREVTQPLHSSGWALICRLGRSSGRMGAHI